MDIENTKTKTKVQLDMPCLCEDEEKQRILDLRAEAQEALGLDSFSDELVSHLVASLHHEYDCSVTGVYMDMWFGVAAENDDETFFVPCDRVEDGLVAIWNYHRNKNKHKLASVE